MLVKAWRSYGTETIVCLQYEKFIHFREQLVAIQLVFVASLTTLQDRGVFSVDREQSNSAKQ